MCAFCESCPLDLEKQRYFSYGPGAPFSYSCFTHTRVITSDAFFESNHVVVLEQKYSRGEGSRPPRGTCKKPTPVILYYVPIPVILITHATPGVHKRGIQPPVALPWVNPHEASTFVDACPREAVYYVHRIRIMIFRISLASCRCKW